MGAQPLVQPLMLELIREFARVHWNANQKHCGDYPCDQCSCCEWLNLKSAAVGNFKVDVTYHLEAACSFALISFDGMSVATELGTKRLFTYTHLDCTEAQFIDWWKRAMKYLQLRDDEKNGSLASLCQG